MRDGADKPPTAQEMAEWMVAGIKGDGRYIAVQKWSTAATVRVGFHFRSGKGPVLPMQVVFPEHTPEAFRVIIDTELGRFDDNRPALDLVAQVARPAVEETVVTIMRQHLDNRGT